MATLPNRVRPGDLITSDLLNAVLDKITDLDRRLLDLETNGSPPGGGDTGAIGRIDVRYQSSSRGKNLVPGDPAPYPHTFRVVNQTNRTLTIRLSPQISAPNGNWDNSAQVRNPRTGAAITSLTLGPDGDAEDIEVAVLAPNNAVVRDQATLTLDATVGAPHNKQAQDQVVLTVAQQPGTPVDRAVRLSVINPGTDTNNVNASAVLAYLVDLRYTATTEPLNANFTLAATLTATPANTEGEWAVQFFGHQTNRESPSVYSTTVALTAGSQVDTRITVRVRAPQQRDMLVDKTVSLVLSATSSDLPNPISASADPRSIRLAHV